MVEFFYIHLYCANNCFQFRPINMYMIKVPEMFCKNKICPFSLNVLQRKRGDRRGKGSWMKKERRMTTEHALSDSPL